MKTKRIFILFLALMFVTGMFFSACNDEKVNSVVNPLVDNNMNYVKTQTLNDVFLDLGEKDTEGTLYWKNGDTALIEGENEYEWVFEPKDNNRFLKTSGVISVLAYEPLEDLNVSLIDWTYGDEANEPVVENNSGKGEVVFEYAVLGDEFYFTKKPNDAGKYVVKVTVQATEAYARKEAVNAFNIEKKPLNVNMVSFIPNQVYTGTSLKPEIIIEGLKSEEDYVVSWSYKKDENEEYVELIDDFISMGDYKSIIVGKGNYSGEVERFFNILENEAESQKLIEAKNVEKYKTAKKVEETENAETAENVEKTAGKESVAETEKAHSVEKDETAEKVEETEKDETAEKVEETEKAEFAEKIEETEKAEIAEKIEETTEKETPKESESKKVNAESELAEEKSKTDDSNTESTDIDTQKDKANVEEKVLGEENDKSKEKIETVQKAEDSKESQDEEVTIGNQKKESESKKVNAESELAEEKSKTVDNELTDNKEIGSKETESKDIESKDIESKDIESNDIESKDIESKEIESETVDSEDAKTENGEKIEENENVDSKDLAVETEIVEAEAEKEESSTEKDEKVTSDEEKVNLAEKEEFKEKKNEKEKK